MDYIITPYALAQFATAAAAVGLSVLVWFRRHARGGWYLFFLFVAVSLWALSNSMEASAVPQEIKVLWSKISYIGSQTAPVFLLLYAFEYSGRKYILSEFKIGILFVIPIFIIIMAATNESHQLIWSGFSPGPAGTNSLIYHHGVLFWGETAYILFLVFVASYVLFFSMVGSQRIYKHQNRLIIFAAIFPWLAFIISLVDLNPFPGLDLICISFLFTGMVLFIAITKEKLMDVVPVSHEFLVENIDDGILVVDENFRITEVNSSAEKMLQIDREKTIGRPAEGIIPFWKEITACFNTEKSEKIEINLDNSNVEYIQMHITPLAYSQRRNLGWVLVVEDITLRKKSELELQTAKELLEYQLSEIRLLQSKLQEQAVRDALTGTFNRSYLDDTLERELARAERKGYSLCLMMIDVDKFKNVNDSHGHKTGDLVISGIGKMLIKETRACDCVCRYGGDEFIVVAQEMKKEDALSRAENWREALKRKQFESDGKTIMITISIGIAVFPSDGREAETLINAADMAMYRAKADGRDCVRFS